MGEALITSRNAKPLVRKTIPVGDTNVGDIVLLNVNSIPTEFIVVHKGRPTGTYGPGCDGIWLLMKDIYMKSSWEPNIDDDEWAGDGEWEWTIENGYQLPAYLQTNFLPLLDEEIQNAALSAVLPHHDTIGDNVPCISESNCCWKIVLLSCTEVGLPEYPSDLTLGGKLDYFEEGTTDNAKLLRVAYYNNTATGWFLRSAPDTEGSYACGVYNTGTKYDSYYYPTGVRPALILPFDTVVSRA